MRFFLFFFPMFLLAYEFRPFFISADFGYERIDEHFRLQENTIREELEDQNALLFGLGMEMYQQKLPYLFASWQYGFSSSSSASLAMDIQARNESGSFTQNLSRTYDYDVSGYFYRLEGKLGYPFRIGPFSLIPLLGIFFEKEKLSRDNVILPPFQTSSGNFLTTSFFGPKPLISSYWLLPLTGIQIVLEPWPFSFLRLKTGYDFRFGWFEGRSSYFQETTVLNTLTNTSTFRGFSTNLKENQFAWSHIFHLAGFFGMPYGLVLGVLFDYEYWRAKSGKDASKRQEDGLQIVAAPAGTTSSLISNFDRTSFSGIKKQIYRLSIEFIYSF